MVGSNYMPELLTGLDHDSIPKTLGGNFDNFCEKYIFDISKTGPLYYEGSEQVWSEFGITSFDPSKASLRFVEAKYRTLDNLALISPPQTQTGAASPPCAEEEPAASSANVRETRAPIVTQSSKVLSSPVLLPPQQSAAEKVGSPRSPGLRSLRIQTEKSSPTGAASNSNGNSSLYYGVTWTLTVAIIALIMVYAREHLSWILLPTIVAFFFN